MDIVSAIVKLNAQTSGRDKVCRFFQYGSKFTWSSLKGLGKDEELVLKIKNLENTLSATRKLLRFGKSFDLIQETLKTIHLPDIFLRVTITLAKLNQAIYLLVDHALWAEKTGLLQLDKKYYRKLSARFWLVTLILSLARNLYEILLLVKTMFRLYKSKKSDDSGSNNNQRNCYVTSGGATVDSISAGVLQVSLVRRCLQDNPPLALDTLKNCADIFLPLSSLGYIRLSSALQGILGMISSVIGVMTVWNSDYKLRP
ncbi:peroxisomal membrane protein 11B-like [Glandiceps talaboti]